MFNMLKVTPKVAGLETVENCYSYGINVDPQNL